MSHSQLTMLSKFVIFSILVGVVGLVLVVVGLAMPPIVGVQEVCACRTIAIPSGRIDPNPLQLPFLVGGAIMLIGGLTFLSLQLFKRQSVKIPVKDWAMSASRLSETELVKPPFSLQS